MYDVVVRDMKLLADEKRALKFASFFQSFDGGYGEGDKFYGLTNPLVRQIVKKYRNINLNDVEVCLCDEYHEVRLFAVLVLVEKYARADMICKKKIVDMYVKNADYINNWDLIDLSVYKILGRYCLEIDDCSLLYELANSGNLWRERMSVVANWILVKKGVFDAFIKIAEKFLTHKHDLIHKAVGWILREMGKSGENGYKLLIAFLDEYAGYMPRTMLRYSLEKLPVELKKKYMEKKFCLNKVP